MALNRIFLTGATGNVGTAVLAELLGRGYDVAALIRKELPEFAGCRPILGDLAGIYGIAAEIGMAGGVIHCASPRSSQRQTVLREDIEATAKLLDAWGDGPFVYMSSQTVYGIPRATLTEESPLVPSNWYDIGKICNEHQIAVAAGLRVRRAGISLRLPLVFAAGARRRDRQFLPALYDALRAGKRFLFDSEQGLATYGSVYIGETDLGRAVVDTLAIGETGSYNLAGGFCTWRELLATLGHHIGTAPNFVVRAGAAAQPGEFRVPQSRSFYDCGRFAARTGFVSCESLDEVVGRFVAQEHAAG